MSGPEGDRVAEVIVELAAGLPGRRGSGYRVTTGSVLTAAHVVADAVAVRVRFEADRPGEWTAVASVALLDARCDVAVLTVAPRVAGETVIPVPFGRVGGRAASVPCTAVGFPRFKLRVERSAGGPAGRYRDSHQAVGTIASLSNWREGSLEVLVAPPERDPDPLHSPWEGMSGAAVWSGDHVVGVVSEHHRSDGPNRLAAVRVDRWYEQLPADRLALLRELTGLPAAADLLPDVIADERPGRVSAAPAVIPSEVPAAPREFVDRDVPSARALDLLGSAGSDAVLVAVAGGAGVGKTALALRLAHRSRQAFPDGQLFVNLSGGRPDAPAPAAVLGEFLRALGQTSLPDGTEDRARLYRSAVARGRYLIVLDDARDEEQARPLLVGTAGSAVLLTSRTFLPLLDTTTTIMLEVLGEEDSIALLGRLAGQDRVAAQAADAARIARSCGGLPLALRIAGARLAARPHWPLARLADRLDDERRRLKELQMGDAEVRAGFVLSYEALGDEERRLFRLLGSIRTADVPPWMVAALLDGDADDAEEAAERLVEEHLLQAGGTGRYQFHDLLRAFAAERLEEETTAGERRAALARVLAAGLARAERADAGLSAANSAVWDRQGSADALDVGETPLAWFTRERANLLGMLDEAYRRELWPWVWRLAAAMWQYLETSSRWTEWRSACELAVSAAERAGDDRARGHSLRLLGRLAIARGETDRADDVLTQAVSLLGGTDDLWGLSMATKDLSVVERLRNHHTRSADLLLTALDGFRRLDHTFWAVIVDRELGIEFRALGQWDDARQHFTSAVDAFTAMGEELQLAATLFELGVLERMQENWTVAADCLSRALPAFARCGADGLAAWAVREEGLVQAGRGDLDAAAGTLERCLDLFDTLDDPRQRAATLHELALVRGRQDRPEDLLAACAAAIEIFERVGDRLSAARTRTTQGTALLAGNDAAAAALAVAPAVAVFRTHEDMGWELRAQRVLAAAYAATGDAAAAHDAALLVETLARYAPGAVETRV